MPFGDTGQSNIRFRTLAAAGTTLGNANIFQNGARVDFQVIYKTA
jgi:hypothetical protein